MHLPRILFNQYQRHHDKHNAASISLTVGVVQVFLYMCRLQCLMPPTEISTGVVSNSANNVLSIADVCWLLWWNLEQGSQYVQPLGRHILCMCLWQRGISTRVYKSAWVVKGYYIIWNIDLLIELGYIMDYIVQTDTIIFWVSLPVVAKDTWQWPPEPTSPPNVPSHTEAHRWTRPTCVRWGSTGKGRSSDSSSSQCSCWPMGNGGQNPEEQYEHINACESHFTDRQSAAWFKGHCMPLSFWIHA